MRKGLTHMVWWYFHSCAVLKFTDNVSGVITHLLAVNSPCFSILLSQVLSTLSESMSLNSLVKCLARS